MSVSVKCSRLEPWMIAEHLRELKSHQVELDMSWNKNLSNNDWRTVGEMAELKRL